MDAGPIGAAIAKALGPGRPSVVLRGSRVSISVDNQVQGDFRRLGLSLAILDDTGGVREVAVGPYPPGRSTASARLSACSSGCQLQTISLGGPDALVEAMKGTATIDGFTVDGQPVSGALDAPWRAAASQVGSHTAVDKPRG